jgi:hypothetical protein
MARKDADRPTLEPISQGHSLLDMLTAKLCSPINEQLADIEICSPHIVFEPCMPLEGPRGCTPLVAGCWPWCNPEGNPDCSPEVCYPDICSPSDCTPMFSRRQECAPQYAATIRLQGRELARIAEAVSQIKDEIAELRKKIQ